MNNESYYKKYGFEKVDKKYYKNSWGESKVIKNGYYADSFNVKYNNKVAFDIKYNKAEDTITFIENKDKEEDRITFVKIENSRKISYKEHAIVKYDILISKLSELLDLLSNFINRLLFILKQLYSQSIKPKYLKISDLVRRRGLFDHEHEYEKYSMETYICKDPTKSNKIFTNKKSYLVEKIVGKDNIKSLDKIIITDLKPSVPNLKKKSYLARKIENYERASEIKYYLTVANTVIIGAFCVCFSWLVAIGLSAIVEKHSIKYIFSSEHYAKYIMTIICIIMMITLLVLEWKFLVPTGITVDVKKITGVDHSVSACWKYINTPVFQNKLLDFLKKILDDSYCKDIYILKKKYMETDDNGFETNELDIKIDSKIVAYNYVKSAQREVKDDFPENDKCFEKIRQEYEKKPYHQRKSEIQNRILCIFSEVLGVSGFKDIYLNKESENIFEDENRKMCINLTTDQIHRILEILIEYKNYTIKTSQFDTHGKNIEFDISSFLLNLFSDLSKQSNVSLQEYNKLFDNNKNDNPGSNISLGKKSRAYSF